MAQPLTIPIVRDPAYRHGDLMQVEVNGELQSDRVPLWGPERERMGAGFGTEAEAAEGFGRWVPYGVGVEGFGWDGQGADLLEHRTVAAFVAGDYDVRVRAVDRLGNAGAWSAVTPIAHRPRPPAPTRLRIADGNLTFEWSDT